MSEKSMTVRPEDGQPLIVELIPVGGVGRGKPIVLPVRQVVVRLSNGTPVVVASEFGPDGAYAVSRVGDDDFNRLLRALGLDITHVQVDTVQMPSPPPGARLIAGPKPGE